MASIQLSGLASGFDWKTFVDSIMTLERTPATRLETEQANNTVRLNALTGLESRLTELRTAASALGTAGAFDARTVSSSNSNWSAIASSGTATGSYVFAVSQLATASRLRGTADLGQPIASTADVSGVTIATLGTATTPTAGTFTVNGASITVALADSLQDIFDRIGTATGGTVTAAYDPVSDGITLNSASPIVLGAGNDTSNFLTVARLNNNGTGAIASSLRLGAPSTTALLSASRLQTAVTAVDGSGNGSFAINGVTIAYNLGSDSINSVIARINASSAGVTASFDPIAGRFSLTNSATGDTGLSISEAPGGLLASLGINSGTSLDRGQNAIFTVNGGDSLVSKSNTLSAEDHGITGLSITASAIGSGAMNVASDTTGMRAKIDTFIAKYNAVQTYIDDQSKITTTDGKTTTSTLSSNREVQQWATELRRNVFAAVPGLSGSITRLESLGIDFATGTSNLTIKDSAKLDDALKNKAADVSAFFNQSSTGFSASLGSLLNNYLGVNGGNGLVAAQKTNLTKANTSLAQQVLDIDRRLVERRALLEASFIAMETAQSKLQQMQTQLTNAFPSNSSSS